MTPIQKPPPPFPRSCVPVASALPHEAYASVRIATSPAHPCTSMHTSFMRCDRVCTSGELCHAAATKICHMQRPQRCVICSGSGHKDVSYAVATKMCHMQWPQRCVICRGHKDMSVYTRLIAGGLRLKVRLR